MFRYFLGLFAVIVLTLALASWAQERILAAYGSPDHTEQTLTRSTLLALAQQLAALPETQRQPYVAEFSSRTGLRLELRPARDFVGLTAEPAGSAPANRALQDDQGSLWSLMPVGDTQVLSLTLPSSAAPRSLLDWALTALLFAAIALVLMAWLWPVARDLRKLESAVAQFGNRNWIFRTHISSRSQVHPLAVAFERQTSRIDELIASHKEMSHAVSHEIRTPLARMKFAIALALETPDPVQQQAYLTAVKSDIAVIDELVNATLEYAILERADFSLNLEAHDFRSLLAVIVRRILEPTGSAIRVNTDVAEAAAAVCCDMHLIETVLRNLIHNALRYARTQIDVSFSVQDGWNELRVADDGPGIPAADRQRVFHSFVQIDRPPNRSAGFGLGLAIVHRIMVWHGGTVSVEAAPSGGALLLARWPASPRAPALPGFAGRLGRGTTDA
jgi:signal transduction histidine kinase